MDDAGQTAPRDPGAPERPEAPERNWGRWILLGVFGCLGLAVLAAIPPAFVAYLALRPAPGDTALAEARRIVEESVRDARVDPRVTSVLGQPIRSRRRTFSSDFDLTGGEVEAVIELHGPEGDGQLHLRLRRVYRQWRIEEVRFEELQSHAIDLIQRPRQGSRDPSYEDRREDGDEIERRLPPRRR